MWRKFQRVTVRARITSVQCNLSKGRIVDLLPLADGNGFVQSWPLSNTLFLGLTRVSPQNGVYIASPEPFLRCWRTWHTDTHIQSDRPRYSVCSNRPHLTDMHWVHVMRPNESEFLLLCLRSPNLSQCRSYGTDRFRWFPCELGFSVHVLRVNWPGTIFPWSMSGALFI